jgi:hypothetical protein
MVASMLVAADLRGTRERGRDVPHHERAARHEEAREEEDGRHAHQIRETRERPQELAQRGIERVGEEEQGQERAEGQGEDDLAPHVQAGKRDLSVDGFLGHPAGSQG